MKTIDAQWRRRGRLQQLGAATFVVGLMAAIAAGFSFSPDEVRLLHEPRLPVAGRHFIPAWMIENVEMQRSRMRCARTAAARGGVGSECGPAGSAFINPDTTPQFAPSFGSVGCHAVAGLVFSRSGETECIAADGQSSTTCADGVPCIMADQVGGLFTGPKTEQTARTNLILDSSDLTAASWTATNVTCTQTATGLHGANTASHCCATASNGTILTTTTTASGGFQATSVILKRSVGSGAITINAGDATYLADISGSLSSTLYKRVGPTEMLGCTADTGSLCIVQAGLFGAPIATIFGIKIATSGDCVDVAHFQNERSSPMSPSTVGFASSPIITSGGTKARAAETGDLVMSVSLAEQYCAAATVTVPGTDVAHFLPLHGVPGDLDAGVAGGSTSYDGTYYDDTGTGYITAETTTVGAPFESAFTGAVPALPRMRIASFYDGLYLNVCQNGSCSPGTLYAGVTSPNGGSYVDGNWTRFRLGAYDSSLKFNGITTRIQVGANAYDCDRYRDTTHADDACIVGDSISRSSNGTVAAWWRAANLYWQGSRIAQTAAKSGAYTSYIHDTEWELVLRHRKCSRLFVLGGINDITQGHDMDVAFDYLKQTYDEAIADGYRVYPMTVLPAGDLAGWNSTKETARLLENTRILADCAAHPIVSQCINTGAIPGLTCANQVDGGSFPSLCPAVNSGDGLHPNQLGEDLIGSDVAAEVPASAPHVPIFSVATASGVGMGAICACTNVTGTKGESISTARASPAECPSADSQTFTQCPNDIPRVTTGAATETQLGFLVEPLAYNFVLNSRNLATASWTKSNVTCTHTATGMRNDSNGASTCAATSSNGTVWQVIDHTLFAPSTRACGSFRVKRRTGTGTVYATFDGSTFTDITAGLSSTLWKTVAKASTVGGDKLISVSGMCASVVAADPAMGLKFATSGDAVDIDFTQIETNDTMDVAGSATFDVATSPIETAGSVVVRRGDLISTPRPTGMIDAVGCLGWTFVPSAKSFFGPQMSLGSGAGFFTYWAQSVPSELYLYDGTNNPGPSNPVITLNAANGVVSTWSVAANALTGNTSGGGALTSAYDGTIIGTDPADFNSSLFFGVRRIGHATFNTWIGAVIRNVLVDDSTTGCPYQTTGGAWTRFINWRFGAGGATPASVVPIITSNNDKVLLDGGVPFHVANVYVEHPDWDGGAIVEDAGMKFYRGLDAGPDISGDVPYLASGFPGANAGIKFGFGVTLPFGSDECVGNSFEPEWNPTGYLDYNVTTDHTFTVIFCSSPGTGPGPNVYVRVVGPAGFQTFDIPLAWRAYHPIYVSGEFQPIAPGSTRCRSFIRLDECPPLSEATCEATTVISSDTTGSGICPGTPSWLSLGVRERANDSVNQAHSTLWIWAIDVDVPT